MALKVLLELLKLYLAVAILPAAYWLIVGVAGMLIFGGSGFASSGLWMVLGLLLVTGPQMVWVALTSAPLAWIITAWTGAGIYAQLANKESLAEAKPIVQMLLNPWYPSIVGAIVSLPLLYGAVSGFDFVGGINTVVLCLSLNLYLRWSSFFKTLEPAWMRKYRRWPLR
jgi:hypothetical protein